jgi:N6-L-threonylcarbamoyladenine synthase
MNSPTILAIESSCDDTSAAVFKNGKVLINLVCNQKIHEQYGGVVPELASRDHIKNILPVVEEALKNSNTKISEVDVFACTTAPGLIGSLMVGVCFTKALAMSTGKSIIGVNHMQAHVLANFIDEPFPKFPCLCLTVSGGHTQIVLVKDFLEHELIGETLDDAAGEAFDKTAKMLGLPYPGGPLVDKYAQLGDENKYNFPEPKIPDLNFSFSGLKTAVLYFLQRNTATDADFIKNNLNDICASVQKKIVSILLNKLIKASEQTGIKEICIAGGVSANSGLRTSSQKLAKEKNWNLYIPKFEYCTDNAAMIAITAYHKFLKNELDDLSLSPMAR